jgi:hypothetical protein
LIDSFEPALKRDFESGARFYSLAFLKISSLSILSLIFLSPQLVTEATIGGISETKRVSLALALASPKVMTSAEARERERDTFGEENVLKRAKQIISCQKRQYRGRGIVIRAIGF